MERRARHLHEIVDRHRFRVRVHAGQLRDQSGARAARLTHADDAAATDVDAGAAHAVERLQPVVLGARADDLAVELGRRVDIVVVVIQAGGLELLGLTVPEQAQRRACLQAFGAHRFHHLRHLLELALLRAAPGRAHAEARGAVLLRQPGRGHHLLERQQWLAGDSGVITSGLRAIAAVLRAAAGFNGEQRGQLHGVGVEVLPVHAVGAVDEVVERQFEQRLDLQRGPARCAGCVVGGGGTGLVKGGYIHEFGP